MRLDPVRCLSYSHLASHAHAFATISTDDKTFAARTNVFKTICSTFVFDKKAKEPEEQLSDLIDARIPLVGPSLS